MLVLFFIACDSAKVLEPCVDIDLKSKIGDSVMTGVISEGLGDYGYCGEREGQSEMSDDSGYLNDDWNGKEVILSWTAPKTAQYSIYTIGSEYDTTLSIKRTCNGEAISCDDDGGDFLDSLIRLPAKADETYLIVLDAYDPGESGNWVLNIVKGEPNIDWDYDTGWDDSAGW